MKKTYIAPKTSVVVIGSRQQLLSGSVQTSGLSGHNGYGGSGSGLSADARSHNWDVEDEEDEDF